MWYTWFNYHFSRIFAAKQKIGGSKRPCTKLCLEALEDRYALSTFVPIGPAPVNDHG